MVTVKSYTDLEQSKKLAEILPLESADMWYDNDGESTAGRPEVRCCSFVGLASINIPCWSLAALLSVLPLIEGFRPIIDLDINLIRYEGNHRDELCFNDSNLIDACVAMIEKLHELKML